MTARPVILLEFNELSPSLMARFIGEGKLPTFARFQREARVFTTEADENAPNLEPWIQWITVHTGLPYREHRVFHLGDAHTLREKSVWDLVSDQGSKVWVCGSMNARRLRSRRSSTGRCHPELQPKPRCCPRMMRDW